MNGRSDSLIGFIFSLCMVVVINGEFCPNVESEKKNRKKVKKRKNRKKRKRKRRRERKVKMVPMIIPC